MKTERREPRPETTVPYCHVVRKLTLGSLLIIVCRRFLLLEIRNVIAKHEGLSLASPKTVSLQKIALGSAF